jgi:hypothetical protein
MREQDDQLNEDITEDPAIVTGVDIDPEDEPMAELPENAVNDDDELEELHLGER